MNHAQFCKDKDALFLALCGGAGSLRELTPNTSDGAVEKHKPVVSIEDGNVKVEVASVAHPMTPEHSIQWIYLETKNGGQIRFLSPDQAPQAQFCVKNDPPVAVYEYCNLHGLWKEEIL